LLLNEKKLVKFKKLGYNNTNNLNEGSESKIEKEIILLGKK